MTRSIFQRFIEHKDIAAAGLITSGACYLSGKLLGQSASKVQLLCAGTFASYALWSLSSWAWLGKSITIPATGGFGDEHNSLAKLQQNSSSHREEVSSNATQSARVFLSETSANPLTEGDSPPQSQLLFPPEPQKKPLADTASSDSVVIVTPTVQTPNCDWPDDKTVQPAGSPS